MKCGLLGGTFDPIHLGHLRVAEEIKEMLGLERILFIPAFQPPHKTERPTTPFNHREQMVRLAIAGNDSFAFSDVEKLRSGKSYSIETIKYISRNYPENGELYFIVGQDAFQLITTWREWEKLLLLCNFVVMTRPGYKNKGLNEILPAAFAAQFVYREESQSYQGPTGCGLYFRHVSFLDISSSIIREKVKNDKSVRYLVPENVHCYMVENSLYS